jgi:hypothetical protein
MEQGYAELFGYSMAPGAFPRLDSVACGTGGNFSFTSVEDGLYLIHIVPDTTVYPLSVPTYYGGAYLWEEAQTVSIACDAYATSAANLVINTGPGGISGTIGGSSEGFRLRSEELIPVPNVTVFLQDSASSELRGFARSDANGIYHFNNLAYGTYYVLPDVAGVPLLEYRKVVISPADQQVDLISFQLTLNGVMDVVEDPTGIEETSVLGFQIYPNPGHSIVTLTQAKDQEAILIVRDLSGREQIRQVITARQTSIDLSLLSSGAYLIEYRNANNQSEYARWIKE